MVVKNLEELVTSIDRINAEYILADKDIQRRYQSYLRWKNRDKSAVCSAQRFNWSGKDIGETCERIAADVLQELEDAIRQYGELHLTPANAKVGDGATIYLYSDSHAGTIVKVTKRAVTVRRDKAILNPGFKPEIIPGGFCGHCTNQEEQSYTYEPDENGALTTVYWSKKYNRYGQPGDLRLGRGRHEFFDYNF